MIVAFTGPESTGKSSLATEMARHFNVPLLPEYAREYFQGYIGDYGPEDIIRILREHKSRVQQLMNEGHPMFILDTDVLVLKIWMECKFGLKHPDIESEWAAQPVDIYFLCKPDIPWEWDPLRENPNDRDTLFEKYLEALTDSKRVFHIVKGEKEDRICQVKQVLSSLKPLTASTKE
jgi:NadR type nicotinamide-nucleotide adenylyltransferase